MRLMMTPSSSSRENALKTVIGIFVVFVMAALMPFTLLTSGMVFVYPVLAVITYVAVSPAAAIVSLLFDVASAGIYMGIQGAIAFTLAFIIPSAFILRTIRLKSSFSVRVGTAVISQIIGIVLTLGYARLSFGKSIIDAFTEIFGSFLGLMSDETLDSLLVQFYSINGIKSITSMQNVTGLLDASQRASYINKLTSDIRNTLAVSLPGALLTASYHTGLVSAFLSTLICRNKRKDGAYVPIAVWYTPYKITFGAVGMIIVALIMNAVGVSSAQTILNATGSLAMALFTVQAISSFERRMKAAGRNLVFRIIIIALSALILRNFIAIYGAYSAVFGTFGAVRQLRDTKEGTTK